MAYIIISTVLLVIIVGFVLIKGIALIRKYSSNKKYIKCYSSVLHNEVDAYKNVCGFIDETNDVTFSNQARILKLLCEIDDDRDYSQTLEELKIKEIFYNNEGAQLDLIQSNRDSYLFVIICMAKAYEKKHMDVIEKLLEQLKNLEELDSIFEHNMCINFAKALLDKDDYGTEFMVGTLDGNYSSYVYDKYQIALYKKIAGSVLVFKNVEYDDIFKKDVAEFAKSMIGVRILKSLGIYEKSLNIDNKEIESKL